MQFYYLQNDNYNAPIIINTSDVLIRESSRLIINDRHRIHYNYLFVQIHEIRGNEIFNVIHHHTGIAVCTCGTNIDNIINS